MAHPRKAPKPFKPELSEPRARKAPEVPAAMKNMTADKLVEKFSDLRSKGDAQRVQDATRRVLEASGSASNVFQDAEGNPTATLDTMLAVMVEQIGKPLQSLRKPVADIAEFVSGTAKTYEEPSYEPAMLAVVPQLSVDGINALSDCPEKDLLLRGRHEADSALASLYGDASVVHTQKSLVEAALGIGRSFLYLQGVAALRERMITEYVPVAWTVNSVFPTDSSLAEAAATMTPSELAGLLGVVLLLATNKWRRDTAAFGSVFNVLLGRKNLDFSEEDCSLLSVAALACATHCQRGSHPDHATNLMQLARLLGAKADTVVSTVVAHGVRRAVVEQLILAGQHAEALKAARDVYAQAHPTARGQRELAWYCAMCALLTGDNSQVKHYWTVATTENAELAQVWAIEENRAVLNQLKSSVPHLDPTLSEEEAARLKRKQIRARRSERNAAARKAADYVVNTANSASKKGEKLEDLAMTQARHKLLVEAQEMIQEAPLDEEEDDIE